MGLDGVELVMEVEDEFKIALSNEEASQTTTVGQLVDLVFSRLRHDKREPCPSQHGFYVIRRHLIDLLAVERSVIRPDTRLEDLMPMIGRKRLWRRLLRSITGTEDQWCKLVRPRWMNLLVFLILPGLAFLGSLFPHRVSWEGAVLGGVVLAIILGGVTTPFKTAFPTKFSQVKDLVKFVKTLDSRSWSREAVFEKIKPIIVRELNVKESAVTLEAHFVKDLGLS